MKQFLPDIPYEKLPVEVLRYLCEKGVRAMHEYGMMDEKEDPKAASALKDLDVRAACFYKAMNAYKTRDYWARYKSDPEAVLALINVVKEANANKIAQGGYSRTRLDFEVSSDIDRKVIISNPHIWDAIASIDFIEPQRMFHGAFSVLDIADWYGEDPVRSSKTVASNSLLFANVAASVAEGNGYYRAGLNSALETAVGFLHLYGNDRLPFLQHTYDKCFKISPDLFDSIVTQLYTVMSKDQKSMDRLKGDCLSQEFGAKGSRSREAAWFRKYMEYLGEKKPDMLLDLVKNAPPLISLVPVEMRRKREFRSLKRLFQLSGDVG